MKKQDITYQEKLNELKLDIKHPNNKGMAFVLLEGGGDVRLFRKLFDLNSCKVETVPGGKLKLEECVGELVKVYPLIIGIRDADFAHINKGAYHKVNMFLTDLHDMEMMLIAEDEVFGALIFEFTNIAKAGHADVREKILMSIEMISCLKFLNDEQNLELCFECGFQDLITFVNLNLDFPQYFSRVLAKSPNAKIIDPGAILQEIQFLKNRKPSPLQLCNGHDFIKALLKFIRECGGKQGLGEENIQSALRISYRLDHFKKTRLFSETKSWSETQKSKLYID